MTPVLFDVDGVLADWCGHLLTTVGSRMRVADVHQWDVFALLRRESSEMERFARSLCDDPRWWAQIPAVPGARDAVTAVRQTGAHVVFVSSPWHTCPSWETARRDWLWRHIGASAGSFASVPSALKRLVHGGMLVEDSADTAIAWAQSHAGRAYLVDAPYNRDGVEDRAALYRVTRLVGGWSRDNIDALAEAARRHAA